MSSIYYSSLALNWTPESRNQRSFTLITTVVLTVSLLVASFLSSIDILVESRDKTVAVPERVARFVINRKKPEVMTQKPKELPKPVLPKLTRKRPETEKPLTKEQKSARDKVKNSGLLALGKELGDLMDTSSISQMASKKINRTSGQQQEDNVNTSSLTANTSSGSGGISGHKYTNNVGVTLLNDSERLALRQTLGVKEQATGKDSNNSLRKGDHLRAEEDIVFTMDKNKSTLYTLYRRARRNNPGLKGKIVLEITIAASGQVVDVRVKSSELNDKNLENNLVARVKQFDFGSSNVETVTVTFPIEFLPS